MGRSNTAKLHHFVPQSYLRGFSTEKKRITTMPLDRSRSRFTAYAKNLAAQTHFHKVPEAGVTVGIIRGMRDDATM